MPSPPKLAAALLLFLVLPGGPFAAPPAAARQTDTAAADSVRPDTGAAPLPAAATAPNDATSRGSAPQDSVSAVSGGWTPEAVGRLLAALLALSTLVYATALFVRRYTDAVAAGHAPEVTSHWGGLGGGLGGWRISPALSYLLGALFFGSLLTFLALRVIDPPSRGEGKEAGTKQVRTPPTQQASAPPDTAR